MIEQQTFKDDRGSQSENRDECHWYCALEIKEPEDDGSECDRDPNRDFEQGMVLLSSQPLSNQKLWKRPVRVNLRAIQSSRGQQNVTKKKATVTNLPIRQATTSTS